MSMLRESELTFFTVHVTLQLELLNTAVRPIFCYHLIIFLFHRLFTNHVSSSSGVTSIQWRNDAPGAPATPEGDVIGGRQNVIKMWDNFARLTARLAKVRVWFNNSIIYLDF